MILFSKESNYIVALLYWLDLDRPDANSYKTAGSIVQRKFSASQCSLAVCLSAVPVCFQSTNTMAQ